MSYSSIIKKQTVNTVNTVNTINTVNTVNAITATAINKEDIPEIKEQINNETIKSQHSIVKNQNKNNNESIPDFCVVPRVINRYNKKYCMNWLTINLDENFYHYDYCVRLFELLMKWVRYNNFVLKTHEHALLGKFISLMYLLSNKKGYSYN